jgi:hypothetical protein
VRAAPDHLALGRAGPRPHADLHLVRNQEPQHRVHRAELLEQVEHQPHYRLHLLVRVQRGLPGGPADIPGGQRDGQLASDLPG